MAPKPSSAYDRHRGESSRGQASSDANVGTADDSLLSFFDDDIDDFLGAGSAYVPPSAMADGSVPGGNPGSLATVDQLSDSADDLGDLFLLDDEGNVTVAQAHPDRTSPVSGLARSLPAPPPTLVGTAGGLQFDLVWDPSVAHAPAGFRTAAIAAAQLYSNLFSNREVINVRVGYGEVGGMTLGVGALGGSKSYGYLESYATIAAALKRDASWSSWNQQADSTLPSTNPTGNGKFFTTTAEAKALGQVSGSSPAIDGYIGLSSLYSMDYVPGTRPTRNQFDAVGAFEHELSEVMGRLGSEGAIFGHNIYTPLDLFRYSSPGVRDLALGPGYFSVDGGRTNLGTYNNPRNGGDAGDWIQTLVGDAYGSAHRGVSAVVSRNDVTEDAVLGYKMTPLAVSKTS